jgi:hypothetical protein
MAKRVSDGRIAAIMKSAVSDEIENWKQLANKPSKAGSYSENYVAGSPKAKWRRRIWKYGPIPAGTEQTYTLSGAISGSANGHIEVRAISLMVTSSLSSSIYIDKIGLGSPINDVNYFYSSSVSTSLVSSSGDAILAHPARGGTSEYTAGDLVNGGYHTASTHVTVTFNAAPATDVGDFYVFIYVDKFWKLYE